MLMASLLFSVLQGQAQSCRLPWTREWASRMCMALRVLKTGGDPSSMVCSSAQGSEELAWLLLMPLPGQPTLQHPVPQQWGSCA